MNLSVFCPLDSNIPLSYYRHDGQLNGGSAGTEAPKENILEVLSTQQNCKKKTGNSKHVIKS